MVVVYSILEVEVTLYIVECGGKMLHIRGYDRAYIMTPRAHAGAGVPPMNLGGMIENLTVKKVFFTQEKVLSLRETT